MTNCDKCVKRDTCHIYKLIEEAFMLGGFNTSFLSTIAPQCIHYEERK